MVFNAPAFLWGLTAVAIPVAVHLLNFRRYRKVYFSNVSRLEEMQQQSNRHRNLRRWLLLSMRIAAIVFMVLAFARPTIGHQRSAAESGSAAVSIYVDNSFSMERTGTDADLLSDAIAKAQQITTAYPPDTRYQLLCANLDASGMQWLASNEVVDAADRLHPSSSAPMLSRVAEVQNRFLKQSSSAVKHAYIISDFQRSVTDLAAMPHDSTVQTTFVPLVAQSADNVYIDTLILDAPAYFAGSYATAEVRLVNTGNADAIKVPVRLYANGRERAMSTIDVPAAGAARLQLGFTLDTGGWTTGYAEIDDYPVAFDNTYYFALHVGNRIKTIDLHSGTPNPNIVRLLGNDSAIALTHSTTLPQLSAYTFAILDNVQSLPSGDAQQLLSWVQEGGSLLVVPCRTAEPSADVNTLLSMLGAPMLGQWQQRSIKATAVDYSNALYRGVFGSIAEDMEMPSVTGHFALQTASAAGTQVITLADGSALLTATTCGEGHVYVFSTPLAAECTDLVAQALFVPTVYNMALFSSKQPVPTHTIGDAAPIALHGTYNYNAAPPTMQGPQEYSALPDLRHNMGQWLLYPHTDISHAGIYSIADEYLAFNYPRRESEPDAVSAKELGDMVAERSEYSFVEARNADLGAVLRERQQGTPLWRLCLIVALFALAAEVGITVFMKP